MKNQQITTLDNGLRVAVDEMKEVETISLAVFVYTGSRNETKANNGISHFLEHMAFKGTKARTARQIAEQFEEIGGRINAYTSREKTVYYVKVLKQHAEFAVEFLSDILQNSTFEKEELEKERGVILQEIAMTNDTPDDIIFDYWQNTAYPNQPIGRSILGPIDNIKKFQQKDFVNYISKQYNYENMAVVAAGNIKQKDLVKYSKKYFTNFKKNKLKPIELAEYKGGDFRKEKKLEQINLVLGFKGFSYHDEKNYYPIQLLTMILGSGMSSRLFQEVRENRGLAYSIFAFNSFTNDSGLFGIYAATTTDKVNELISATREELLKITKKITDQELNRVLTQYKAGILMAKESTNSRSQKIGSDILCYNRIIEDQEVLDKISVINKSKLIKLADKILSSSKPTFSAIGQVKNIMDYDKISASFN
jgi:predicted Zn-dependent peptidase